MEPEWVTVAGGRANEVAYVELGYPSDLLRNNVVLVDTPGVNDLNEQRADVAFLERRVEQATIEVAIVADGGTEGDVEIEAEHVRNWNVGDLENW